MTIIGSCQQTFTYTYKNSYQIISQELVQFEKILTLNLPTKKMGGEDFFINYFLSIVYLK